MYFEWNGYIGYILYLHKTNNNIRITFVWMQHVSLPFEQGVKEAALVCFKINSYLVT